MNDHSRFQERGGDPKYQMEFNNQIRDPINLTDDLRTPFYKYIRPDPLHHIKLGVMQDILMSIQKRPHLTRVLGDFLDSKGLKKERAGMPGLLFNGEQIDRLTRESNLRDLFQVLSDAGEKVLGYYTVKYLESCKQLYKVCVKKVLDPDYQKVLDSFSKYFNVLFEAGYLNQTTKAHIIMDHFGDLMRESGRSLFLSDCQGLESVHSALRKSDIRHGCHVTNCQGTPHHKEMSIRSVAFYNSRTLGYVMPDHLIPPDPGPENDEDDNNNGQEQDVINEDEENNERKCETPRGFRGDILENESGASLLTRLEEDLVDDDQDKDDDEANLGRNDDVNSVLNASQEASNNRVNRILNDDGGGTLYTMNQLLSHIRQNNLPLRPRKVIQSDGNCFFESIQDLAEKFQLPVPQDKLLLRQLIADSMESHPEFLTWVQIHFYGELRDFETVRDRVRQHGHFTDSFGLCPATAAHVLGNDNKTKYFVLRLYD